MRRMMWLASLAVLFAPAASRADVIFTYNFAGPNGDSPPPFSPVGGGANPPTFTASTPTFSLITPTVVRQSALGLGVSSGLEPVAIVGSPSQRARVDGFGTVLNVLAQETLSLTFTNTNSSVTQARLLNLTLAGAADTGPLADFDLSLNGVSVGTFDFPTNSGGVLDLTAVVPGGLPIQSGDTVSLTPLFSLTNANGFAVAGAQVAATVPEPATVAVFGLLAAGAGVAARRRRAGAVAV